jgi:protein-tyrosine phosphatase
MIISAIGAPSSERIDGITYVSFDLVDSVGESGLLPVAERAHRHIAGHAGGGGRVLVHCAAGVSRSASVLAAHLLLAHPEMSLDDALARIRQARSVIQPNARFMADLRQLERRCKH